MAHMLKATLAEKAGVYASHVSGYLRDGKRQRDLPGHGVRGFQLATRGWPSTPSVPRPASDWCAARTSAAW